MCIYIHDYLYNILMAQLSGDVDFPGTYNYDVLFRVVPGFTFAMAQSGQLSEDVEQERIPYDRSSTVMAR